MNTAGLRLVIIALASAFEAFGSEFKVHVEARDADYHNVIVSAPAPKDFPGAGTLKGAGRDVAFQVNPLGDLAFILPELKRGDSVGFTVGESAGKEAASARREDGRIDVSVGGKRAFVYHGEETELPRANIKPILKRGGYIHPVLTPSGKLITDDYPANHLHHHGIWFPWTKTVFEGRDVDFWNMGEGKGKVEFVKFLSDWSGPVEAGFAAQQRFVDLTLGRPKTVLIETWTVSAFAIPGSDAFVFDLVSTQKCATSSPLILPKYYYGGLGFRGNWDWNGEEKCLFLTSNGETNRVAGNETPGNWCYIGGDVAGAQAGIAILCHPSNFRAPQPMRLHPKEPFFCFAPSQLGDWSIEPGKPYVSRYRFVVKDGPPDKRQLDEFWNAYAHPPVVTVSSK